MKIYLFLALFSSALWAEELTIKRIFESPELDGIIPIALEFSPGGQRLSFLRPKTENFEILDLWEYDLSSGEAKLLVDSNSIQFGALSEAEKARRERMRISRKGIVEYKWSHDAESVAFPADNDIYLLPLKNKLKRLTNNPDAELDVKFSPQDHYLSFVRNQNLFILDTVSMKEVQLTKDGKDTISNGVAEFIAQEEMDRFTGYWWSQDEKYLAFIRVDESSVKMVERYEINEASVSVKTQRYPEVGTSNAKIALGLIEISKALKGNLKVEWVDLGTNPDIYLPRVQWTPDHKLSYQVQSRNQKELSLYLYDPYARSKQKVMAETDQMWINLHHDLHWLKESDNFIWSSEFNGFNHLYLHDRHGKLIHPITSGKWAVDDIMGVDEKEGWVYFTAGVETPLESHLYRAKLGEMSDPESVTKLPGMHKIKMSKDAKFFVDEHTTSLTPVQVSLAKASGEKVRDLSSNEVKEGHPLFPFQKNFIQPEFGSYKSPSGETLYYSLYKNPNLPKAKHPLIVLGYGGPHVQSVNKGWKGKWGLYSQVLAQKGFLVASFDNRGSARRGKKFENALFHNMGVVEVEDQKAGVEYLIKHEEVDPARVGFMGWSYGGFLSLMLATKAPDTFYANVAIAPVTDFRLYDTHYTERYMGKPQDDPAAYERANVLNFAKDLKARLLIMHGMADDNVLFTNSTLLFKKLQDEGKIFESVTYPGSKHGMYGKTNQTHVFSTSADFFERHLKH
jgi:dipeptidyl-peptidase-4